MPLVVVTVKNEQSNFVELEYGEQIELARSRKFLSGSEGLQFISDKLCQPVEPVNYVEKVPLVSCDVPMQNDVLLVIDGSFSTQQKGFNIIISFLKKVIKAVKGDVHYGAIQYSDIVKTEFTLGNRPVEKVVELLDDIEYDGGYSTVTGAALTNAYEAVHSGVFGARDNTTKIIILVTDGRTKDEIEGITNTIQTNDDTTVIAVGLKGAPISELNRIATNDKLVFYTKDFERIWNFFGSLTDQMCHLKPKPAPVPDMTVPETTSIPELTSKLTTKLASVISTTVQTTTTLHTTTKIDIITTSQPSKQNVAFVLPKEIEPVDAQQLVFSTPADNVTVIIGSSPVIVNKPKDEIDVEYELTQDVIDSADNLTTSIELVDIITDVIDEDTVIMPVVSEETKNTPTILSAVLPSMKLAPITTNELIDEVEPIDLTNLTTPENIQVDLTDNPVVLFFPENVTALDIEETLMDAFKTSDLTDLETNTSIVVASTLLSPEEPVKIR